MIHIILRHYRRFGVFSIGMAAFCTSLMLRSNTEMAHVLVIAFVLICMAAFGLMALGVYSVKPGQRGILEIAGISGLICTLLLFYLPLTHLFPSLIGLAIFFGIMTSLWFFLQSETSKRIGARTTWRDRHSATLPYPARMVWNHVVPGELEASAHSTGRIAAYEEDPDDPDNLRVIFKGAEDHHAVYDITFLEKDKPSHCRWYFEGNEACGTLVDGVFSMEIEVLGESSCSIIANEERSGLSLGDIVERWFDDALGFQHDRLHETLDSRYGDGSGVTKPFGQTA